jgi:hypothetical protein
MGLFSFKPAFIEQSMIRGQKLHLRVKTDDLGSDNRGRAHVFDATGHATDVPLEFTRKSGDDDVFETSVPLTELRDRGFDVATLQATAAVDVPGRERSWENLDHKVTVVIEDAVVPLPVTSMRSEYKRTAELFSGTLEADVVNQSAAWTGSHTSRREAAITTLRFQDKSGFFGDAQTLKVELHPQHTRRMYTAAGEIARGNVEDLNALAVITLRRQPDGAFHADAGPGNALFHAFSEQGMAANSLNAIKVAVFDPGTGKEDTSYGRRYDLVP